MRDHKLLPCPLCGGKSEMLRPPKHFAYRVACVVCRCNTGGYKTEEETIAAWNTRTQLSHQKGD